MLSGDDMICYLLFPEVSLHCIDKWRKQDHAEVPIILTVWTQIFQSFEPFPCYFYVFFFLGGVVLFLLSLFETVNGGWWKKLWRLV